jgi:N-methylhydantoinase B
MPRRPDPAELAIFNALFASIAEEMGVTLGRTAHSPNIKERRDYSCAVFDAHGRLVAQAAHIPVHLGAMPTAVQAAMPLAPFRPGDLVILNDPFLGGTHLPDITMVSPVFVRSPVGGTAFSLSQPSAAAGPEASEGRRPRNVLAGFVASRAHHADVGGISPGSMPVAEELLQEGLVIPPLKLLDRGRLNQPALDLLLRNMRNPDERRGDLDAQAAAHRIGEARFADLVLRYGLPHVRRQMRAVMDYAERMTRAAIQAIPDGAYEFEDALDDDGVSDDPVPIRLRLTVEGDAIHCDFTGSAPQRPSSVNAVAAVTRSAVYYVVRCLLEASGGGDSPTGGGSAYGGNDGCFRPVTFTLPQGSIVNAGPPHAVAAGNVETSQRIVDVVLGALAPALPDLIPAASAGTMNNVSIGGHLPPGDADAGPSFPLPPSSDLPSSFAYYETIAGGAGASPSRPGLSAVHTHMTNTMNTPVEALEIAYPFRVLEYALRRGSGGHGRRPGGDGLRRTYEFLAEATVSLLTERRRTGPWGLAGGAPGQPGRNLLHPAAPPPPGKKEEGRSKKTPDRASSSDPLPPSSVLLPSKTTLKVHPGDRLTIETPGGGAFGRPRRRKTV